MSQLIVQVCEISGVENHPNAERLDIYAVKGWKIIANRVEGAGPDGAPIFTPRYRVGDRVVYCPPDSILPLELSDRLEITKYLSPVKDEFGNYAGGRVRAIRLRGQPSYGCMFAPDDPTWEVGLDVAERYGVRKWEPPPERAMGDAETPHPAFHAYTSIENVGNFPDVLVEGEEVVVTEKIHGCNCRVGKIADVDEHGAKTFFYAAGSHGVRRKEFDPRGRRSEFWEPLTDPVKALLDRVCAGENNVVLFGEIFGAGVQDMAYGLSNARSFRAFDIAVNGVYLGFDAQQALFKEFGIETVPILYRGPYSRKMLDELTSGPTAVCDPSKAGAFKGREGVVVTPTVERTNFDLGGDGRVILKSISVDYLARKNATDGR